MSPPQLSSHPERDALVNLPPSSLRQASAENAVAIPPRPNLWNIVKHSIGKDLTKLTLPVVFNEPLSFLQRLAEDVEYAELLDIAAKKHNVQERAAYLAAFVVSHYAATPYRPSKPFNPLLGETFELYIPGKFAYVAEQVAHHPPISAVFAAGNGWTYDTAYEIKNKFKGNGLEVWPEGTVRVTFDDGQIWEWQQAHTWVHNIILGDLWIDNVGTIVIKEITGQADCKAIVKLRKSPVVFVEAKKKGDVVGKVVTADKHERTLIKLQGNWNKEFCIGDQKVWQAEPRPAKDITAGHVMTKYAWMLNSLPSEEKNLPKTDSRLRPDQRAWENGLYEEARKEKERLENEQRQRRKQIEDGLVEEHTPRWFQSIVDQQTNQTRWVYKQDYWNTKLQGWPDDLPHIF